ncbi:terminal nucleotidyltransferase 4B [Fagus crenata]
MNPMSVCSSSSSSSTGSSSNAKAWIVHGIVAGVAIAVAVGAHAYLGRSGKFRSRVVGIIPAHAFWVSMSSCCACTREREREREVAMEESPLTGSFRTVSTYICQLLHLQHSALHRTWERTKLAATLDHIGMSRNWMLTIVIDLHIPVIMDLSFDAQNGPKAAEFIQVYSGGIGSYALLAMLMAMLQSLPECQTSPEQNLGVLLVHFLDFYGRKLNTSDVGVSCKGAGSFFLKSSKGFANKGWPFLFTVEDPQAPENDIGKNSFNYFQIRSAFSMAFSTLTNPKTIMALDPILLEHKGGSKGDVTFNSLLPGAGEPLQHQYGEQQGILCNWQLGDEEEPLPRGNSTAGESTHSSGKKRKASSKEKSTKKVKENGRHNRDSSSHNSNRRSPNGFVHYVAGSPWNR